MPPKAVSAAVMASRPVRKSRAKAKPKTAAQTPEQRIWTKTPPSSLTSALWNMRIGDLKVYCNYFEITEVTTRAEAVQAIFDLISPGLDEPDQPPVATGEPAETAEDADEISEDTSEEEVPKFQFVFE